MNKHELPMLPYAYDALEPYIDKETMTIHHDKHHASYVNNLNAAIVSLREISQSEKKYEFLFEKTAEELITNLDQVPEEIRTAVKNNAGGHVNHSMFWQIIGPVRNSPPTGPSGAQSAGGVSNGVEPNAGGEPTGALAEEIKKTFGSFAEFQNKFNDVGVKRFGSGWVWLVRKKEGGLDIISTPNQDNPITDGLWPLMGNDVWEHAYYLTYKNMRADYLKAWWNVVNWSEVNRRFTSQ